MENMNLEQMLMVEKYRKRFNEILYYKSGELLNEQLVPANLNALNIAMQNDKELYTFLNTPAKDLPPNYKYLVDEITNENENETLFILIKNAMKYNAFGSKTYSFFTQAGSKLTGFAAYIVSAMGDEVLAIKMFSFYPQGNSAVLIRDLMSLLDELVSKYNRVTWNAMRNNPANKIYQKAIEKYNGKIKEHGEILHYIIENQNI